MTVFDYQFDFQELELAPWEDFIAETVAASPDSCFLPE